MPKIKQAMPSFNGKERILFPGCENFGKGSYDPFRGLHTANIKGKRILTLEISDKEIDDVTVIDRFPLRIYEN